MLNFNGRKIDGYNKATKNFLDGLDIRADTVKKTTYLVIKNIIETFQFPQKNEQFRIRTQQQFNLLAVILKFLHEYEHIDTLLIGTFSLNVEARDVLLDLARKGKIKKLTLFLASSYTFRDPNFYEETKHLFLNFSGKSDVKLVYAWLHLKITLVQCGYNYFQMEGSMNFSQNSRAEQLLIENNEQTYKYDLNFFENIVANHGSKDIEIIVPNFQQSHKNA